MRRETDTHREKERKNNETRNCTETVATESNKRLKPVCIAYKVKKKNQWLASVQSNNATDPPLMNKWSFSSQQTANNEQWTQQIIVIRMMSMDRRIWDDDNTMAMTFYQSISSIASAQHTNMWWTGDLSVVCLFIHLNYWHKLTFRWFPFSFASFLSAVMAIAAIDALCVLRCDVIFWLLHDNILTNDSQPRQFGVWVAS